MNYSLTKDQLRAMFLKKRKNVKNKLKKTFNLNFRLLNFIHQYNEKFISGYFSTKNEIDICYALSFLNEEKFKICFPFIKKVRERLFFSYWNFKDELEVGKFNIKVPRVKLEVEPDFLIVPLVCFDSSKFRVGYGGGYYDRTIEYLKNKKNIKTIGVSFDEQITTNIPKNHFDQKLDFILTPSRLIK